MKLLDGEAVGGALTRMQMPTTTVLTPVVARELAQREGVPAIVTGEIDPVGKSYVISAKVISAANGSCSPRSGNRCERRGADPGDRPTLSLLA